MARRARQIGLMNRIRQLRDRAGLSQGELAERAGISQTYLSRIENTRRPGSVAVMRKLAAALDAGITDLFEKDGRDQIFMALLDDLSSDQQEEALAMLEAFVRALKKQQK